MAVLRRRNVVLGDGGNLTVRVDVVRRGLVHQIVVARSVQLAFWRDFVDFDNLRLVFVGLDLVVGSLHVVLV